jgi:hypothetical protein
VPDALECLREKDLSDFQGESRRKLLPLLGVDNSQTGYDRSPDPEIFYAQASGGLLALLPLLRSGGSAGCSCGKLRRRSRQKAIARFLSRSPLSYQFSLILSPCLAEAGAAVLGQELSRHGKKYS